MIRSSFFFYQGIENPISWVDGSGENSMSMLCTGLVEFGF